MTDDWLVDLVGWLGSECDLLSCGSMVGSRATQKLVLTTLSGSWPLGKRTLQDRTFARVRSAKLCPQTIHYTFVRAASGVSLCAHPSFLMVLRCEGSQIDSVSFSAGLWVRM